MIWPVLLLLILGLLLAISGFGGTFKDEAYATAAFVIGLFLISAAVVWAIASLIAALSKWGKQR